jgi:ribA/ribD-fused uncharacterized protein
MIYEFKNSYHFLSNFYLHPVTFEGITYPSSEHAYVAAKTLDVEKRLEIANVETAGKVKRLGRALDLRPDWEEVKVDIMRTIVREKFKDPVLRSKLARTAPHELVEGNWWNDRFWGQCPVGVGENWLGRILMEIRDEI